MRSRVRLGIRVFRDFGGGGQMPAGEAEDDQWRGLAVRHVDARIRFLRRTAQDLPFQVQRLAQNGEDCLGSRRGNGRGNGRLCNLISFILIR